MHRFRSSMEEGGKDGSKGFVKRVTSTFSINKKKNTTTSNDPKQQLPRSKSTGANYESMRHSRVKKTDHVPITTNTKRTKSAGVSPQPRREPRREKIDESRKQRCFIDDNESVWLSSECASTSSPLEESRVSVSFHFNVDERIVSWLSHVANTSLTLNQDSSKDPPQKSFKKAKCSPEKSRKDGKIPMKSLGTRWPESSSSSKYQSPQKSREVSPNPKVEKVESGSKTPVEKGAEIIGETSKRRNIVEPLFWPFEQKFDWTPDDILKHFSMSPRRKKSLRSKSAGTSPRSMRAQLQTRKQDLKEGCRRKLMFNGSGPNSKPTKIPEFKRSMSNGSNNGSSSSAKKNIVKRNKSLPSLLRKSNKVSSKVVPIEASNEDGGERIKGQKTPKKLIMTRKSRTFLEDDFALMNDFSIENAVGLGEFKGKEGIDSDFNTDGFLFDDSL